jgi:hypothetical protein
MAAQAEQITVERRPPSPSLHRQRGRHCATSRAVPHPGKLLVASLHISARLYAKHVPLPRIKLDEQAVYKIVT